MKSTHVLNLILAAGTLCLGACSKPQAEPRIETSPIVAQVGDRIITVEDLEEDAARRARAGRTVPDRKALLDDAIRRAALLERARRHGLDQAPEIRHEIENLLISRLIDRELTPRRDAIAVTAEEVEAAYKAEIERHTRPAQVRLAVLHLEADPHQSEQRRVETRARMETAHARALELSAPNRSRGGDGFGLLSLEFSDDQVSRHRGGDIGWIQEGRAPTRFPESVIRAGWALEVGELSDILETPGGFYLVRKTDSREATVVPLASIEATLRQSILARKRRELDDSYRRETAEMIPTTVHEEELARVVLPVPERSLVRSEEVQPPALPGLSHSNHGN